MAAADVSAALDALATVEQAQKAYRRVFAAELVAALDADDQDYADELSWELARGPGLQSEIDMRRRHLTKLKAR